MKLKTPISRIAEMILMIICIIAGVIAIVSKAQAEELVYQAKSADGGETPVIVYVGGSGWRTEGTILENECFENTNIIYICCRTKKYNLTSVWRAEDRKEQADRILRVVREQFPKVKDIVIMTYSAGGCMAEPIYERSRENGMRTKCAVMLDSVFRKYPPEGMKADGLPVMYAVSRTDIETHVTGWTRKWIEDNGLDAKAYDCTHGELETLNDVQRDIWQFIRQGGKRYAASAM